MSGLDMRARLDSRAVDVELSLDDGDVLAVLGANGAGKSTVLSLIAGLLRPDSGRITLGEDVVTDTEAGVFVRPHARGVAMLAQQALLFPHMSVAANVAYGPRCRGLGRAHARSVAHQWLQTVDAADLADRRPAQLSGGQAQRVAIARALAAEPQVLLLDEPMAALDVTAAPAVRRVLRSVLRDGGRTAVMVTHDLLDALGVANKVIVIDGGRIVERGSVRDVLTTPRSEFAARIAGVNLISGVVRTPGTLTTAWGAEVVGVGEVEPGSAAVALFHPSAVSVHPDHPHGSPRNVVPVTITELDLIGGSVRVRGADQPDGGTGLAADVTVAAATDLDLAPGRQVYFAVKAHEVQLLPISK
ncbi:sulfate/molybdate ABC transporter ATP-binding protein [Mycolicibacterium tokaiense]|uniref:ABC transporter ATP-binding protein n=1 Tax=Mycolicibacterium tokaiense TaxID=39695 RepID=A0A378TAC8_9MYCO|nr:ATP-binding cassette domain-containing protein [Mycolicibacterium tokaiense]BBY87910.1 molybdenum ABC transporter ATP-binding protein [Mycolicibacterium tokaiense]STZ57570.1 ABC transporter ATP-binding protein [Mycolicibacterium tokaiense]